MSDLGQVNKFIARTYGVVPEIYSAAIGEFIVKGTTYESSGLSLGEQLYTPRGSQGFGMSTLIAEQTYSQHPETNTKANIYFKITN